MPNTSRNSKKPASKQSKKPAAYLIGAAALAVIILVVVLSAKPGASTKQPDVRSGTNAAPKTTFAAGSGGLVINIQDITETASFYPAQVDGVKMEVLAVKAPDGTIRTALNTCQVCYDSGRGYYVQEGSVLVCQNCGNRFRTSDVEKVKGGCNPVPILKEDKIVDETTITVPVEFLQKAKVLFADWKR